MLAGAPVWAWVYLGADDGTERGGGYEAGAALYVGTEEGGSVGGFGTGEGENEEFQSAADTGSITGGKMLYCLTCSAIRTRTRTDGDRYDSNLQRQHLPRVDL